MATLETVVIKNPKGAGTVIINAADYDPKQHKLASDADQDASKPVVVPKVIVMDPGKPGAVIAIPATDYDAAKHTLVSAGAEMPAEIVKQVEAAADEKQAVTVAAAEAAAVAAKAAAVKKSAPAAKGKK